MNPGVFPNQYGARLAPMRINFRTGAGSTQYFGEAIVLATADVTGPTNTSRGSGAPIANVPHFVLQLPYSAGRRYQNNSATAAFCFQIPDGTITGGNPRGIGAVDLQTSRGAATNVASGPNSLVGNSGSTASGSSATAFCGGTASGSEAFAHRGTASATRAAAFNNATASGQESFACCGPTANANANNSWSGGPASARSIVGSWQWGSSQRAAGGDRQFRLLGQAAVTTNATPTTLTSDGAAEATSNTWVLPNNYVVNADAKIIARNTANNDSIVWRVTDIVVRRDATAATTALQGTPTVTQVFASASMTGCTLVVNTNTTNGSVRLQFTGLPATTIAVSGWLIPAVENG